MIFLAELDENHICKNIKQTISMIDDGNHVEITSLDDDLLWRKYENGAWSTEKFEPAPPVPGPDLPAEVTQLKSQNADIIFALVSNNLM